MIAGSERYTAVLAKAFPSPVGWYGPYESYDRRFDYVLYLQGLDDSALRPFLGFLEETILVDSALDEIWALEMHMKDPDARTDIGELVYRAKAYEGKPGEPAAATDLAARIAGRMALHPGIRRADAVVPIPANPPKEPHNLPDVLAAEVARVIDRPCRLDLLQKTRPTDVKNLANEDKLDALDGAYSVSGRIDGLRVLLVDDLCRSGSTLGYAGALMRASGASEVVGIVATKTLRS